MFALVEVSNPQIISSLDPVKEKENVKTDFHLQKSTSIQKLRFHKKKNFKLSKFTYFYSKFSYYESKPSSTV